MTKPVWSSYDQNPTNLWPNQLNYQDMTKDKYDQPMTKTSPSYGQTLSNLWPNVSMTKSMTKMNLKRCHRSINVQAMTKLVPDQVYGQMKNVCSVYFIFQIIFNFNSNILFGIYFVSPSKQFLFHYNVSPHTKHISGRLWFSSRSWRHLGRYNFCVANRISNRLPWGIGVNNDDDKLSR